MEIIAIIPHKKRKGKLVYLIVEITFAEQLAIIIALTIVVCTDIFINPIFVATMPTHKAYTEHNNNSLSILFSACSTKILDFTDFAEQLISYIYLQNRVFWI